MTAGDRPARGIRSWRWPFLLWTALIVLLVVPWTAFQSHAHWDRIAWVPFVSPPVRLRDMLHNVLLYLPWGYLYPVSSSGWRGVWNVAARALLLAAITEAAQVFSHGRFPSMTDVACNVGGAAGGALWAQMRGSPARPRA